LSFVCSLECRCSSIQQKGIGIKEEEEEEEENPKRNP
jgi:hypothetical protein